MNNSKLAILGIVAVIMAGWAVLQNRMSRPAATYDFSPSPLIEGLSIDAIASISVASDGGTKSVTLDRTEKGFAVRDKENYPADISKINGLISKCLDIRVQEKITSNPANHADLKVTPETARYVVSFMDKDGKIIAGAAVSPGDPDSGRAHGRLLSSDDVYVIDQDPWISTGAIDYLNSLLLEVPREKIIGIAVHTPKDHYNLSVSEDGEAVKLEGIPAGQKQKDSVCKSVFRALSNLSFEDVVKESPEGAVFDSIYSCKLKDTTVYKLEIAKVNEKYYTKLSADFLDKTPVEKERRVESEEELKQKEAKLQAIDSVNTFNERHLGWIYQIPSYKAGDLTKPLSELTESDAPLETTSDTPDAAKSEEGVETAADPSETVDNELTAEAAAQEP
jgi:hypothetical protein